MSIKDLEEFLEKLKKATDSPILKHIGKFVLDARNENIEALKKTMNLINNIASDRAIVLQKFIPLYDNVFEDQDKTISEYEKVLKRKFNPILLNGLSRYYNKLNRKEDVISLHKEYAENFSSENQFLFNLIVKLQNYKKRGVYPFYL